MVKFVNKSLLNIFPYDTIHRGTRLIQANRVTGKIPLVTAGAEKQGVSAYIQKNTELFKPNSITIDMFGNVFYHNYDFFADDNIIVLHRDNISQEAMLYLASVLNKVLSVGFSYGKQFRMQSLKSVQVQVPVTPTGELDTAYMASYVQKIEASYVQKIEAYLAVLGYKSLEDCQINQHDLNVLHAKPKIKKFKVENLLYKVELKWHGNHKFDKLADTSESKTKEFNLPLLNAKHGNNGIMFYGRKDEWDQAKNIIDVVSNGAVATGDVYFQTNNISVMWDAYALNTKQTVSAKAKEYIATSLKKAIKLIFGWENKAVWSKVKNIKITLPVTSSDTPDWQFMEDYITAIEKLKVLKIKQFLDTKINAYKNIIK